jgi:hypothetical protein
MMFNQYIVNVKEFDEFKSDKNRGVPKILFFFFLRGEGGNRFH